MLTSDAQNPSPGGGLPLVAAADLQDHLMVASHDLERLQRLLEDAGEALMGHFYGASNQMNVLRDEAPKFNLDTAPIKEALQSLAGAITALQFQDMATQLIAHTQRRLRNCADRIARGFWSRHPGTSRNDQGLPRQPGKSGYMTKRPDSQPSIMLLTFSSGSRYR